MRRFDVRMGTCYVDRLGHAVASIALSHDGNCVLAACLDSCLRLLDCQSGELLAQYTGKHDQVTPLLMLLLHSQGVCTLKARLMLMSMSQSCMTVAHAHSQLQMYRRSNDRASIATWLLIFLQGTNMSHQSWTVASLHQTAMLCVDQRMVSTPGTQAYLECNICLLLTSVLHDGLQVNLQAQILSPSSLSLWHTCCFMPSHPASTPALLPSLCQTPSSWMGMARQMVRCWRMRAGRVCYWDLVEESLDEALHAHAAAVTSLAMHPGGECLLTASTEGIVKVWH